MNDTTLSDRYAVMLQIAKSIGGFMDESNVAIWDSLLMAQVAGCIQGNLLEIGVFKGRSASILCQQASRRRTVVGGLFAFAGRSPQ